MIVLNISAKIQVLNCPKLVPSSSISANPACTFVNVSQPYYFIKMTSINSSTNSINLRQTITILLINITNCYSTIMLPPISLSIYYTQDTVDLVATSNTNTITLAPSLATISDVNALNGFTNTLLQPASYSIMVSFNSGIPVGDCLIIIETDATVKVNSLYNTSLPLVIQLITTSNISNIITQTTGSIIESYTTN